MIKNLLSEEVAAWRALDAPPGAWLMKQLVLTRGIEYRAAALPKGIAPGRAKLCFHQARKLTARRSSLTYVEGYAARPKLGLAIHHAWAVTRDGAVVDVTWNDPQDCSYIGVPFTREEVKRWTNQSARCLFEDWGGRLNVEMVKALAPEIMPDSQSGRTCLGQK